MRTRALLFIGLGFGFLLVGYLITSRGSDLPQGQLTVEVAPSEADVLIDGVSSKPGERQVDIGPHSIKIAMPGFKQYEAVVDITQATPVYVGIILNPNQADTQDWFNDNSEDQKLSESINDRLVDDSTELVTTKYPIFSRLPVTFGNGAGGLTKIDSEAAIGNSGKPSVGIYASSPRQRQEALNWINNRNYTVSDLDVVFYGARIPIGSEKTE